MNTPPTHLNKILRALKTKYAPIAKVNGFKLVLAQTMTSAVSEPAYVAHIFENTASKQLIIQAAPYLQLSESWERSSKKHMKSWISFWAKNPIDKNQTIEDYIEQNFFSWPIKLEE